MIVSHIIKHKDMGDDDLNSFGRFIVNGSLMTLVALFMRAVSVIFNVYISNQIGAEGLGLFTLITTVYGFALTVATSGVNLAATRLVSEALGKCKSNTNKTPQKNKELDVIVKKCINYSLAFSLSVGIVLFLSADFIGNKILFDKRTISSLRLLAFTLTPTAISSALSGYFTAVRRVYKNAIVQLFSQFTRIFVTVLIFSFIYAADTEKACLGIVCGTALSEVLSFALQFILYINEKNEKTSFKIDKDYKKNVHKKLLGIALPVAFSTYLRSGLISLEHILIPIGLEKSGANKSASLAAYGTVQSMVFPIVLFPSAILSSFAGLLIPEVAESNAANNAEKIKRISEKVFKTALLFAIGAAGIIGCFAKLLGDGIYPGSDAGKYIRVIAPLIPVMYIDTSTDAILKGLGEQVYTMFVNIVDAGLSVILVIILLPKFGIWGYIMTVYFTELLNATLSITRLLSKVSFKPNVFTWIFKPIISIIGATILTKYIFSTLQFKFNSNILELVICIVTSLTLYLLFLIISGAVKRQQIKEIILYTKKSIT